MKFAQPIWLVATVLAVPLLMWIFRIFELKRQEALKRFASEHLLAQLTANVSMRRRRIKRWLFILGTTLCLLALARPQIGFRWEEAKRKGIDILFAVDTSRSMLATDVNPDRLMRAKMAVLDLLAKLTGDRVGLVAFAGTAFLQCPLTLDYDAFRQSVEALDTTIIPKGGTNVAAAIQEAEEAYSTDDKQHKILVLITDGEDLEANGLTMAKAAAERGVKVFTVGVGTTAGELLPVRNEQGAMEFIKDDKGQPVKSRLDEGTLRRIAEATGGMYEPLGQQGEGLESIYEHGLGAIPKQELSARMNKVYVDRFQWPLAFGMVCLILEMLLGDCRRVRKIAPPVSNLKFSTIPLLGLILVALVEPSRASPQSAENAYQHGKFEESLSLYKNAAEKNQKNPELRYNLGTAAYKSGQFPDAVEAFQRALQTDQIDLQQQTFYNLGNAQYRLGQPTEKTNPQQTIQIWQQALKSYENALQLKKDDLDAKFNYELVKKKLEELQKQNPPPPQDDKDKKDQEDKKDPKENEEPKDPSKPEQQGDNKDGKDQQDKSKSDQQTQPGKDGKDPKDPSKEGNSPEPKKDQKEPPSGDQQADNKKKGPDKQQQPQPPGEEKDRNDSKQAANEPKPLPGQMSKEEARSLLDSQKGDEKKMPAKPVAQGVGGSDESPIRDW